MFGRLRAHVILALACCLILLGMTGAQGRPHELRQGPAELGSFSPPFTEPTINGVETKKKCIPHEHERDHGSDEHGDKEFDCKPAAVSMAVLTTGDIVYFNGLEGTEDVDNGVAFEYGNVSINDQTRLLELGSGNPTWSIPKPADGGANADGYGNEPLIPGASTSEAYNDGALFCADVNFLANGLLLAAGGTAYYSDPGIEEPPVGVAELEGLRDVRVYDPETNSWAQAKDMNFGRWYPTMVTLGDGKIFIAGGVQKLIKPFYPNHPTDSGRNVVQTETFNPATGKWTYNGASADRSLPLFPRLHLLPNGHVYYNAAGQVFNPNGFGYDEAAWNIAASFNPKTNEWTDLGVPGIGTMTPGFRGSSFSVMLPLSPKNDYKKARFLSAGGVVGTTPGAYIANNSSAITTIETSEDNALTTEATGPLNEARWYSTGVALPTGEVVIFSGADRDEVVGPGTGFALNRAELFDPETATWKPLASSQQLRTYHNTAALLPDGRVLVGGHAPIPTLYGSHTTLPGGFSPNDGRDPSFEVFSPPYLFFGPRPAIVRADDSIAYDQRLEVVTHTDASQIESVVLVRNTSLTHLIDGDQRTVELEITARHGRSLTVLAPPNGNVAPPGPYMLFVNKNSEKGLIPSVAEQVFVGR